MLKTLNESLISVITLSSDKEYYTNVGNFYKGLDNTIEVLRSYRFVEEITINRDGNDPNVTVNGKPFFLTIHDALLIGTAKYTVISVDGAIATFDDADECVEYHLTKRDELLGKILS